MWTMRFGLRERPYRTRNFWSQWLPSVYDGITLRAAKRNLVTVQNGGQTAKLFTATNRLCKSLLLNTYK